MKIKKKKQEKRSYYVISELIVPFLLLFVFAGLNLYLGVHIGCYAIIFLIDESYVLALGIGIFLYFSICKYIDRFYIEKVHWKKSVFYILYYLIYYISFCWAYRYFLWSINTVTSTLITTEFGAALAFTYRVYPAYIFLQIMAKFVRFIGGKMLKTKTAEKFKKLVKKIANI